MIKTIIGDTGRAAPVIICDQCGELIKDAGMAWAMWKNDGVVFYLHKSCIRRFEYLHDHSHPWRTQELDQFMTMLVCNTNTAINEDNLIDPDCWL